MSNRLLLNDINDYVLPSQECVNPIFSINTKGTAKITLNTDDNELEMYFIYIIIIGQMYILIL